MKFLCAFLLFVTIVGCGAARTSVNSELEQFKPPVYEGTLSEIHELAYEAAKKAFPEEIDIFKKSNGKVIIERDWFWRGDTIIEVDVKPLNQNECIIEAESRPNWHRVNPSIFNVSKDELSHYLKTLKLVYDNYKIQL